MNYYPHHIGDFNNSTRHLNRIERSVYRDAIELYYSTEKPLMLDIKELEKRLICIKKEEKKSLALILNEFFIISDNGYAHLRCEIELDKYRANASVKAKAGRASVEARRKKKAALKAAENLTGVKHVLNSVNDVFKHNLTNQEPRTNNHKPNTGIHQGREITDLINFDEPEDQWR